MECSQPSCCQVVWSSLNMRRPKQLLQFVKLGGQQQTVGGRCWLCSALNLFIINAFAWARTFMPVQFAVWHIAPPSHCAIRWRRWSMVGGRWSMVECWMLPHASRTTTVLYRFLWAVNMNVFSILVCICILRPSVYICRNKTLHWEIKYQLIWYLTNLK